MQKLNNIRAVGFDLDDTLVSTEGWAFGFENEVLRAMNRQPMSREIHLKTWGMPLFEVINIRSPGIDIDEFRKTFTKLFQDHIHDDELDVMSPETIKAVGELAKRGLYLFVLTGREGTEVVHLTDNHPVILHFKRENIFHKGNLPYMKPDPRTFDWLSAKGFKPAEVVYVGDSVHDGRAAAGAGINFIATLESGIRTKGDFAGVPVAAFIHNLSELTSLIN